jgi:NAD(P)-dependent dehydrogenase (short-subunit alcohol dehydrogenase family)
MVLPSANSAFELPKGSGGPNVSVSGKVVIITGASSGIGAATAKLLACRGASVALAARRADLLAEVEREIISGGGQAVAIPADVTRDADIETLVRQTLAAYGRIDALVNNAGVAAGFSILADSGVLDRTIAVNLLAPAHLMRAVIPTMLQQGGGSIVNIGSIAGEIGVGAMYAASKFGLRGLNDAVRREFLGRGIRVTLIEPGYIRTAMTKKRTQRMPGPEVVANAVLHALERPRRKMIVPWYYQVPRLLVFLLPRTADRVINRQH